MHYRQRVTALSPTPRHVSPEQLEKTVRYLTQTVHPRNADNIDNLNRSVEYIKSSLSVAVPELPRRASPIGYYDSAPGSRDYPLPAMSRLYPDRGTLLPGRQNTGYQRRSSGKNGIVIIPGFICLFYECPMVYSGIDFSDHLNYWQHDIPAVMITDTAFYRNKQYHLPGDTETD